MNERVYELLLQNYFDMDDCLKEIINYLKPYPRVEQRFKLYRNKLASISKNYLEHTLEESANAEDDDQCFKKYFNLKTGFCHHVWNISKLKGLIKEFEIRPGLFPTRDLMVEAIKNVDVNKVDPNYKKSGNEPIIVVDHPLAMGANNFNGILVDGNHRVVKNYKKGISHTLVYVVNAPIQFKGMNTPLDVILFKIISNIYMAKNTLTQLEDVKDLQIKKEIVSYLPDMLYRI
ncbi:hypothetical protein J26TS2_44740 [Shouchella clausii]|nr:hypothetical protein J26TS2_44740 [Shouchella clausii]